MKTESYSYIVGTLPEGTELNLDKEWNQEELIALSGQTFVILELDNGEVKLFPPSLIWYPTPSLNRGVNDSSPQQ